MEGDQEDHPESGLTASAPTDSYLSGLCHRESKSYSRALLTDSGSPWRAVLVFSGRWHWSEQPWGDNKMGPNLGP